MTTGMDAENPAVRTDASKVCLAVEAEPPTRHGGRGNLPIETASIS